MAAFVPPSASPISSATSNFVSGKSALSTDPLRASRPASSRRSPNVPSMTVLSGLDTVNQDSYTFSRFILGPFQPIVLSPNSSDEEREVAIRAAYRQVFGNAYLMEEERQELEVAESQFKIGNITAKEFVRCLAKSHAYKQRFFEGCSQYRFIELNYMHLLGRAPDTRDEMTVHHNNSLAYGVDYDIDSYIDSDEYNSVFGNDTIPFLRFRGAYTPCDSFNKQCALKGGWANSDKAMGGAAITGYNGSDGRNLCNNISSYILGTPTSYENVAKNTPLKTTAPNWIAYPNPAVPPTPVFVTAGEVREMAARVNALQDQYDFEISKKNVDQLAPFRAMVHDMAPMLDRGFSYADPALANPDAKLFESPLDNAGGEDSDYQRVAMQMFNDTVSRLEYDLEEAKAQLRVMTKALEASTPMTSSIKFTTVAGAEAAFGSVDAQEEARPRIKVSRSAPRPAAPMPTESKSVKLGPISVPIPTISAPSLPSLPSLPKVPKVSLPFGKKE